jgi:hypothetical protein
MITITLDAKQAEALTQAVGQAIDFLYETFPFPSQPAYDGGAGVDKTEEELLNHPLLVVFEQLQPGNIESIQRHIRERAESHRSMRD